MPGVADKYGTDYGMDFVDSAKNATIRVRPLWALGLDADDFTGSPTRWAFEQRGVHRDHHPAGV
jgi:hypothetical protein